MEINNRKIYKYNRSIHRDFGYFFVFMTMIYSISGIAINHHNDWNPDFVVNKKEIQLKLPNNLNQINESLIKDELLRVGEEYSYLMYDSPTPDKIKVYFKDGSMLVNLTSGVGELERVKKRHVLFEMNWLHRNPGGLWTIASDIFAGSLLLISITGLFMLRGKNSIKGRGKWLVGSGFLVTLMFIFLINI